jgi:hypothetical protein
MLEFKVQSEKGKIAVKSSKLTSSVACGVAMVVSSRLWSSQARQWSPEACLWSSQVRQWSPQVATGRQSLAADLAVSSFPVSAWNNLWPPI